MINSLNDLFNYNYTCDTIHLSSDSIPICQHNIYKYSPICVIPLSNHSYKLIFPETQLSIASDLDINELSDINEYNDPLPSMNKIKAKEGEGKQYYYCIFTPSDSMNIENILEQFYLSHVNNYNLDIWYKPLASIKSLDGNGKPFSVIPEAKLITLTTSQVQRIALLHEQSSYGKYLGPIMNEIQEIASELAPQFEDLPTGLSKGDKFFWKMTTRSAKDSWFYKEQNLFASIIGNNNKQKTKQPLRKCEASSALDVVSAMIGSSRVSSDCASFLQWKVKEQKKNPLRIVIQHWVDFPEEMEFRCFAFNGKITAINQLCWSKYIDYLEQDILFQEKILFSIEKLMTTIQSKIPWNNYILDIIYDIKNDCSQICEFNPFGPYSCTGSQLFSWELDSDIILRNIKDNEKPILRVLRPWMKVEDQFILKFDTNLWDKLSNDFKDNINNSTQRCPCCRRKSDPKGFKLPPTQLYYPC